VATATIVLEDDSGHVACKAVFDGGWDPSSHAHQHARLMLEHMDSICTRVSQPELTPAKAEADKPRIVLVDGTGRPKV
jgi:hypothetical protein